MTIDEITRRLSQVVKSGGGYQALCPAHDDKNPSLSISQGRTGVLLKCHAGCTIDSICAAINIAKADLFPSNLPPSPRGGKVKTNLRPVPTITSSSFNAGLTLDQYAAGKKLPMDFLRNLGLTDSKRNGDPVVRMTYLDISGVEIAVRFRLSLNGPHKFAWRAQAKPCLYGLWRLPGAKPDCIVLVEGESDCHTLWLHRVQALGLPGAGHWKEIRDAAHFNGFKTIYVVVEPDPGGDQLLKSLTQSSIRDRVMLVDLKSHKDVSGLHLTDQANFPANWQAALDAATPFADYQARTANAARANAWAICQSLAESPDILSLFAQSLALCGVVGEERIVKLLYLAVTSRLLDKPISVAVKGPSSGGKSYLVDQVLSFFPKASFYALSAMSEHSLAYSEEPLVHRHLVIYEAVGLGGDFGAYLMRSLLTEGRVRYETVEATKEGIKPKLIEREGPTGLLVTTTSINLHPENETRMFSMTISDTQEQTRRVLFSLASEVNGSMDKTLWLALQEWLAAGSNTVTVPFARELAELVPPVAVRLRRDFGAILNLIRAHALLHQASRETDQKGRIVAKISDYEVVRDLVVDLLGEVLETVVPGPIIEIVNAVESLLLLNQSGEISLAQLATKLNLERMTVWRRAKAAIARGYLRNAETKRYQPAKLVLADPMITPLDVLPDPDLLQQGPSNKSASIKFMLTRADKIELSRLGYSQDDIENLTPAEAATIIAEGRLKIDQDEEVI